ncbi:hypothetical protein AGLY_001841 [Aphis glycines]|uniref:Uncharacterized protein n=1 Tax=Aphis glycines TaxID=307491 RepID=A0A6G0U794_APHGL|nr:hypothetical protein AGLY_001841 [Aphis glycines]
MDGKLPRSSPYDNDFHRRLNELKQKLKPFQNKHTTEYINKITKSSRLPRHTDSVEQVSSGSSRQDIQRRVQNLVKTITSREVLPECKLPKLDILAENLAKMINHADFNISETADNVNSSATINCNKMSRGNISEPGNAVNKINQVNDGLSAYDNNKVSGSKTESTEIVTKKLKNIQL